MKTMVEWKKYCTFAISFITLFILKTNVIMKKISFKVSVILLAGCMMFSSCFVGKYALFNSYVKWQTNMTSSKFVNAVVAFIIAPLVSSVCTLADVLVLNTIEFWSGSNPVQANIGKTRQVMGQDGRYYAVTTQENGYEITAPTGEVTLLCHNQEENSWSVVHDGVSTELFRFNGDGTIQASLQNGEKIDVTTDEAGLYKVRMAVNGGHFFAVD